tara:strand:- start:1540 stop:2286 length:747 start_codon:yes stop_codon:yes gene_type:complete
MHKHLLLLEKKKRLYNLCVWTIVLQIFLVTNVLGNDVTGDFNNNYDGSTVDSNNDSNSTTNNYNATGAGDQAPVMSSIAPTVMGGGGSDSCLLPTTTGIQITMFGLSSGTMEQDPYCNRRKNARLLGAPQQVGGLGLQISGISILCASPEVFKAMVLANTPCPVNDFSTGKLLMGKNALLKYRENPAIYVVGYEDNKLFWDTLLKVGEELEVNEESTSKSNVSKLSLSDRFRTSKRTDGGRETPSVSR